MKIRTNDNLYNIMKNSSQENGEGAIIVPSPFSHKRCWEICDNGHEWETTYARITRKNGCPYCTNKKVLSGYNDVKSRFPKISQQWNYRKNTLNPANISKGSNKKVWWVCDKGHEWEAMINSRTRINKTNCPVCMRSFVSSAQEKELLNFLKSLTNYLIIENSRSIIAPYELDIYIPKLNIAFEFNGTYWHSDQQIMKNHNMTAKEYHTMKTMLCSKENIQLFHITEYDWLNNKDMVEAYIRSVLR